MATAGDERPLPGVRTPLERGGHRAVAAARRPLAPRDPIVDRLEPRADALGSPIAAMRPGQEVAARRQRIEHGLGLGPVGRTTASEEQIDAHEVRIEPVGREARPQPAAGKIGANRVVVGRDGAQPTQRACESALPTRVNLREARLGGQPRPRTADGELARRIERTAGGGRTPRRERERPLDEPRIGLERAMPERARPARDHARRDGTTRRAPGQRAPMGTRKLRAQRKRFASRASRGLVRGLRERDGGGPVPRGTARRDEERLGALGIRVRGGKARGGAQGLAFRAGTVARATQRIREIHPADTLPSGEAGYPMLARKPIERANAVAQSAGVNVRPREIHASLDREIVEPEPGQHALRHGDQLATAPGVAGFDRRDTGVQPRHRRATRVSKGVERPRGGRERAPCLVGVTS